MYVHLNVSVCMWQRESEKAGVCTGAPRGSCYVAHRPADVHARRRSYARHPRHAGGDASIDDKGRSCVGLEMRIDRPRNEKVLAFHKVRVIVDDLITLQCQERAR